MALLFLTLNTKFLIFNYILQKEEKLIIMPLKTRNNFRYLSSFVEIHDLLELLIDLAILLLLYSNRRVCFMTRGLCSQAL